MTNEDPLSPIFENAGICMACGKEKHVNASGYCESCWVQFSHLRKKGEGREENGDN